jgi:protein tyrosine phosphatase
MIVEELSTTSSNATASEVDLFGPIDVQGYRYVEVVAWENTTNSGITLRCYACAYANSTTVKTKQIGSDQSIAAASTTMFKVTELGSFFKMSALRAGSTNGIVYFRCTFKN